MTIRDDVWNVALVTITSEGTFKRADLGFSSEKRHTVRRTLRQMESHGWLSRTSKYSPIWRPGPRAIERLRLSEEVLDAAHPEQ